MPDYENLDVKVLKLSLSNFWFLSYSLFTLNTHKKLQQNLQELNN